MLISRHSGGARAAASAALTTIALLVLVEMAVAAPRESAAGAAPAAALWAWGHNDSGQLGDGTTTDSSVPVQVIGLTGVTFAKSGLYHTVAAREDGTVWGWGNNEYGQLGGATTATCGDEAEPCSPTPILIDGVSSAIAVSAGYGHSLALTSDGTVWAWGRNDSGQLGNNMTTPSSVPVQVVDPADPTGKLTGVVAVAGGFFHSLAIRRDGSLWAWGRNTHGELGTGTLDNSSIPVRTRLGSPALALAVCAQCSFALATDGTVWAWGHNAYGQLGNGTIHDSRLPVRVRTLAGVKAISGGGYHGVALKGDGTVWTWGRNDYGQLGTSTTTGSTLPVPVTGVSGVTGLAHVYVGALYTVVLQGASGDPQQAQHTVARCQTPWLGSSGC